MGADDDSFKAIGEVQDKEGHTGVFLQPTVSKVAQHAFKRNLARLGPLVLPWFEMVRLDACPGGLRCCRWCHAREVVSAQCKTLW